MPFLPTPYIQNHINWCWATSAKIVGLQYLLLNGGSIPMKRVEGVPRIYLYGLRSEYIRMKNSVAFVDAWQNDIVIAARSSDLNPTGNAPEGDEGKERALKYIVTGDPFSTKINILTIGRSDMGDTLFQSDLKELMVVMERGISVIGNYQRIDGNYHSVVLSKALTGIKLYDPWDGFAGMFTFAQMFHSGFLSNSGPGVIKWIQFIN